MHSDFLFNVFVLLAAACLIVPLTSRFKLGSVLGYLAAGILIGPFGVGLIDNSEQIMHYAEFGVIMMLFVIGLELEPSKLWRMRKAIVGLGGLQVLLSTAALTAIGLMLGYDWRVSLTIGMALTLSSTALVLQILQEKDLMRTDMGESSFAVLLFQDIAVIPMLVILPLLAIGPDAVESSNGWVDGLPGWLHALIVGAALAGMIFAGKYLSYPLFSIIAKTNIREVFTATSLMLVIGITLLMQLVGVSPGLGAFVAGIVLASSEYRHTLEADIQPFKGLLLGLFFISVGMGMNFDLLNDHAQTILAIVLGLLAVKIVILLILGKWFKLSLQHNIGLAFVLCQGGEFGFVLFQFAGSLGILAPTITEKLMLAVAFSIALTPLLMMAYSKFIVPRFMSMLPEPNYDEISSRNTVIIAGFGRFGQVVGRFLMGQHVPVTIIEKDPEQVNLLRKFGFKGYFGDATRADILKNAHAADAKLLIITVDDPDACVQIVECAKREFPNLTIYARARNRQYAYTLHKLGVHYTKREVFDSSLAMAQEVMVALGRKESDMQFKAMQFKRHDEYTLKESFAFFDQEPELIQFAKKSRAELERILQQDEERLEES